MAEYKDGAKAAASRLKLIRALTKTGSFAGVPLKEKPEVNEGVETVGDFKLNRIKFSFDFDKAVESLPEDKREASKSAMMKLTGDKATVWFGRSGNKLIQVSAKDWTEAKAEIDAYLKGANPLDKDESFLTTRKQLPAEASIVMMADTARFLEMALSMAKDTVAGIPGFPGGAMIPDLKVPRANRLTSAWRSHLSPSTPPLIFLSRSPPCSKSAKCSRR